MMSLRWKITEEWIPQAKIRPAILNNWYSEQEEAILLGTLSFERKERLHKIMGTYWSENISI